jgi:NAD(P)-dependent dehydrogenase (short-subunit alcohol dehydrogenase family)
VGDPDDCLRVVREVIERHGRLDILVNNAGVTADRPILSMTVDDWQKVLRVNLSGAFYMSKPALEHMIERGSGRIINISSITGEIGNIGQANYAASKSGLFGLTKTLAREAGVRAREVRQARRRRHRPDGQRRDAGADRDRDDGRRAGEGDRVAEGGDPDTPHGSPGGDRPRGGLPGRRCLGVHHRAGLGRQRRPRHVRSVSARSRSRASGMNR